MKFSEIDIMAEIEKILMLGESDTVADTAESESPRRRGRKPTRDSIPIWSLSFYNPKRNRTFALISMCIKDDFEQSLSSLALRVAMCKKRPAGECLAILRDLKRHGLLGYYDDDRIFRLWTEGGASDGLESMCG